MSDSQPVENPQPVEQSTPTRQASERLTASATAVNTLREDVESGKLRLDPGAGENIIAMLAEQKDQVEAWLGRADSLARRAPLGQNPVGEAMAAKFEGRAGASEDRAFGAVLTHYRQVLDDAHDAVSDAMKQYRDLEEQTAESFQKLMR